MVEDRVIEEKPEGVGTTVVTVTEEHGKRMEFQGGMTTCEQPRLSAIHLTGEMFNAEVEWEFEELASGTRVTQGSHGEAKGWFKALLCAIGWMMKKTSCKAMNDGLTRVHRTQALKN